MSQNAHLSNPDPQLVSFLAAHSDTLPNFATMELQTMRAQLDEIAVPMINKSLAARVPDPSRYSVQNHTIETHAGESTRLRTVTPTPTEDERAAAGGASVSFPILVWFHGGGGVMGSIDMDDSLLKIQSVEMRVVMFNVNYRLAPEHPFPAGLDDCVAGLKWAVANAPSLSGSVQKGFIVGGISAGGNYAASAVHRALRDPFFKDNNAVVTGSLVQIPSVVHPDAYPKQYEAELLSLEQNKDAPLLGTDALKRFYQFLGGSPSDPDLSPLLADHTGLPRTYIQVCGLDPLRDEGLLYARLLREAGVEVKLDVYPGLPHGFHASFSHFTEANRWKEDLRRGMEWLLRTEGGRN